MIIHGEQIRAARALLGWNQAKLATRAEVGQMTVKRFESKDGPVSGTIESLIKIQKAIEATGIIFLPADDQFGVGVRFAARGETLGSS